MIIKLQMRFLSLAAYKGYEVAEVFRDEGISGGLVDRPGMKAMLNWLRQHKAAEPVVLIDDISRLARDTDVHRKLRNAFGWVGARRLMNGYYAFWVPTV